MEGRNVFTVTNLFVPIRDGPCPARSCTEKGTIQKARTWHISDTIRRGAGDVLTPVKSYSKYL